MKLLCAEGLVRHPLCGEALQGTAGGYAAADARLLRKAAAQIPGCGHGEGCGGPDRLHPDHRPQLVQPWVAESLPKGTEVLYPENLESIPEFV